MRKLTHDQVEEKIKKTGLEWDANSGNRTILWPIVKALVDSINECMELDWTGRTVTFKEDTMALNSTHTFEAGLRECCYSDSGQSILILIGDVSHEIAKEYIYLSEEE